MPWELRSQLEESAKDGSRSLHAEIISRLEESFVPQVSAPTTMGDLINQLMAMGEESGVSVEVHVKHRSYDDDGEEENEDDD